MIVSKLLVIVTKSHLDKLEQNYWPLLSMELSEGHRFPSDFRAMEVGWFASVCYLRQKLARIPYWNPDIVYKLGFDIELICMFFILQSVFTG